MNEREINKLRNKFILMSTLTIALVMALMAGVILIFTVVTGRNEVRQTMNYIVAHNGYLFPSEAGNKNAAGSRSDANAASSASESDSSRSSAVPGTSGSAGGSSGDSSSGVSSQDASESGGTAATPDQEGSQETHIPFSLDEFLGIGDLTDDSEFKYSTRYFAVLYDQSGMVSNVVTSHISSVDEEEAEGLADQARKKFFHFGEIGRYYYQVSPLEGGGTIVIYLDRTSQIFIRMRVAYIAAILIVGGTLAAFFIMRCVSDKIIAPEVENVESQKRFITNASHELKTPLAVIRANTEMQEMLGGSNEWTESTMRQVSRMDGLIKNLVLISRSQEKEGAETLARIMISDIVKETVETFQSLILSEQKTLTMHIQPDIWLLADESRVRQLVLLLMDNAVKYCDDKGAIGVSLLKEGKKTKLVITNSYAKGKDVDYSRFFERFYREDQSHSEEGGTGGYGIGLSVAEGIVRQMKGEIGVSWKDGVISFVCVFAAR